MYCASQEPVKTNIRRYYFYILSIQTQTHLEHWKVLDKLLGEISAGFDNRWRLPHRPLLKNPLSFGNVVMLPKERDFYNGGSIRKFVTVVGFE